MRWDWWFDYSLCVCIRATTTIKQWLRFCQRSGHTASSPPAGSLITFLLELHQEGRAISALYSLDGNRLGEHPTVRRFMTGYATSPLPCQSMQHLGSRDSPTFSLEELGGSHQTLEVGFAQARNHNRLSLGSAQEKKTFQMKNILSILQTPAQVMPFSTFRSDWAAFIRRTNGRLTARGTFKVFITNTRSSEECEVSSENVKI